MLPDQSPRLLPLAGGSAALLGLVLFWFLRRDDSIPEPVAPPVGALAAPSALPEDPTLVEVGSERRKVPEVKVASKDRQATQAKPKPKRKRLLGKGTSRSRARARAKAEEALKEEGPELVPFVVEPIFDSAAIPDFDVLARCDYHSRLPGGDPDKNGRAVFRRFIGFVAGNYADPLSSPEELIVRFDHPGALPAEVVLRRGSWSASGDGYVARPRIRFEPIEATISLGLEQVQSGRPFRGAVHLVEVSAQGDLSLVDEQPLDGRIRRRKKARLRVRRGASTLLAIALPSSEGLAPDLLVPYIPGGAGNHEMLTGVRTLLYEQRIARVVDPFGDPYAGAKLVGIVDENRVAMRHAVSGAPVMFRGHVFIQTPARGAAGFDGTTTSATTVGGSLGLMTVKAAVGAETEQDGVIDLSPILEGVYEFVIKTPLNPAPVHAMPFERSEGPTQHKGRWKPTFTISAPVGGVQVERPPLLGLRSKAWRHAKISLTAGEEVIAVAVDAGGIARACVPPFVAVNVRVESGKDVFTAQVAPLGHGDRAIAVPVKVSGDSDTDG